MQVSAHRTRMHSCARSSADLSRSQRISADLSRSQPISSAPAEDKSILYTCCALLLQIHACDSSDCNQMAIRFQSDSNQIAIHACGSSDSIRGHQGLHITCCSSLNPASFRRASQHASHAPRGAEREHTGQSPPKSSRSGGKWAKQWST